MSPTTGYKITDQYALYFLTITIVGWVDIFTRKRCKDIIIESLQFCQLNKGLVINAFVIMSNHIHLIGYAKANSKGLSSIIRDFKKYTAYKLLKWVEENEKESRKEWVKMVFTYHAKYQSNTKKHKIWQSSNAPKVLLYPKFTNQKLNYIHNNPVVAGIVEKPEYYMYSSARNYIGYENLVLDVEILDTGVNVGMILV